MSLTQISDKRGRFEISSFSIDTDYSMEDVGQRGS